jgi:integrase
VAAESITFAEYLSRWLEVIKPTMRYASWLRHEQAVRLHVTPALGPRALGEVNPDDLERLYASCLASGLAPQSVLHVHHTLHKAMRRATRQGIVDRNVVDLVDPPRVPRTEMRTLTAGEARRFLSAAEPDRLHALFVLALTNGLRQGELIALRWHQLDCDRRLLRVTAGAAVTESGRAIADTKTHRSRRPVALTALSVRALEHHRVVLCEEAARRDLGWNDVGLVFPNRAGRLLNPANLLRRHLHPILDRAGLPRLRFHDLRHTFATLALEAGIHPRVVADMLGHASVQLTLDRYSHVAQAVRDDAADRIGRMLE